MIRITSIYYQDAYACIVSQLGTRPQSSRVEARDLLSISLRAVSQLGTQNGGIRPVHQKSTCLTQLSSGSYVVQIWSRSTPESEVKSHRGEYFLAKYLVRVLETKITARLYCNVTK